MLGESLGTQYYVVVLYAKFFTRTLHLVTYTVYLRHDNVENTTRAINSYTNIRSDVHF
jgi:hypothetical protein